MARPFVYLVGGGLPRNVEWKLARHADIVLRLPPPPPWPSSARHPIEPARSYSFQKLGVFNLTRFSSLLFFDPDVFWLLKIYPDSLWLLKKPLLVPQNRKGVNN